MTVQLKDSLLSCFTPEQYRLWRSRLPRNPSAACSECTPGYQARMKQAGRCDNPDVFFEEDEEGATVGRFPRFRSKN